MITIVSGLPRSGTSLMMQMLAAGGMPVLTDDIRKPDEDNPRGYFEWEKIARLCAQPEIIAEAEGKAVKIISRLLYCLPQGYEYKVIFMRRSLTEIIPSQNSMLRNRGLAPRNQHSIACALEIHVRELLAKTSWPYLEIFYRELVLSERLRQVLIAQHISKFLALELDFVAMSEVIDESLYRQRVTSVTVR